ncbi:AbrB family transcriptional regulator [Falsirhodobacter halotolerans]|uniref:AbrB family transcriptional regulator n=1 Tax=Falsirhodobacter halotolerans TaxID=1146892 RepID=UPI001FD3E3EA|nr:AbrB family transcriptional regulator [Falsirhodobacter halotolerans]MCJ8140928.1 AbrB family transcriptional regulator [Falsirhodobacter halotolerans]
MTSPSPARRNLILRWMRLGGLSLALVVVFEVLHFPAALLLGPMLAAIVSGLTNTVVHIPRRLFTAAQGMVGMMMAASIPADFLTQIEVHWPTIASGTVFVTFAAASLGYLVTRAKLFPGTTAIWGSSPGAATAMVLMSGGYGADMRLVAFMQYLRVACCALVATLLARAFAPAAAQDAALIWFPPTDWGFAAPTTVVGVLAAMVAPRLRLPGGGLLGALFAGILFKATGLPITLHPVLLAAAFAVIGCSVGMRFTRDVVRHAARALPAVLASITALIAMCAAFGVGLHVVTGVDLLTALLATSPGGADTVAIIAASASVPVDVAFVMTMQVARFLFVVMTAPTLARFLSRDATRK